METKLSELKHLLDQKKSLNEKLTLNRETLACYGNLPIKTHLKKNVQSFSRVTVTSLPPSPQLNRFRSLHPHSSNNSQNTHHKHLPLTGTNHCNSRLSEKNHL